MGQPVAADDLPANLVPTSDLPSGNAVAATPSAPQASQADVRKVDQKITPAGAPRRGPLRAALEAGVDAIPPIGLARRAEQAADILDKASYKAGEKVTDAATAMGLPATPAALLGAGTNVGINAAAGFAGGEATAASKVNQLMQKGGREMMAKALKAPKAAKESGAAAQAIEYLLQEGVNVTKGGAEKLTAQIDELDAALTKSIENSANKVSTAAVFQPIKDAIAKFKYGLDHAENSQSIRQEALKFFNHPEVQQALEIPVQTAQKIKQAVYKELGDRAYTFGTKSTAQAEGKKAVARGLKEGIEEAEPAAAGINQQMSQAINARDLVESRALQAGSNNLVGLGWMNPKMMIPWLMDRSPLANSLMARGLYSGARPAGQVAGATASVPNATPPRQP